jgi:hypothetical protein
MISVAEYRKHFTNRNNGVARAVMYLELFSEAHIQVYAELSRMQVFRDHKYGGFCTMAFSPIASGRATRLPEYHANCEQLCRWLE